MLKRNNLLDAHSKVRGFSSFCVEALIIKYKKIEEIPILDCFFDPVDPLRNLFASISNENLFKFYLLQKTDFKFKKDLDYLNSDLYILKKAPLSLIERLKRDPHVVSVVYIRENILVELIDYLWAPKKKLSLDSQFWGENNEFQKFYFNSKKVYKKTSKKVFFKRYSNFKFEKVKETDKALQKTYNFFK